jgi:hypothetical protein
LIQRLSQQLIMVGGQVFWAMQLPGRQDSSLTQFILIS